MFSPKSGLSINNLSERGGLEYYWDIDYNPRLTIKSKYGKNAILRGTSLMEGATQKERNKLIGGHNAE